MTEHHRRRVDQRHRPTLSIPPYAVSVKVIPSAGRPRLLPTNGASMAITDIEQRSIEKPAKGGPPRCAVCNALEDLPTEQSAALLALLTNPEVRYVTLSEELAADADYPLNLHYESLRRHARGRCSARTLLRKASER